MAEQDTLPLWNDIAGRPDFLAADRATKEATRLNYRHELAKQSLAAGGDEKAVNEHLSKFDAVSIPTLTRTANDSHGKKAAIALDVASARAAQEPLTAAEIAAASVPAFPGFKNKDKAKGDASATAVPAAESPGAIATDWARNAATVAAKATTGLGKALYGAVDLASRYPIGGNPLQAGNGGLDSALRTIGVAPDFGAADKAIDANVATEYYQRHQQRLNDVKGAPTELQLRQGDLVMGDDPEGAKKAAELEKQQGGALETVKRVGAEAVASAKYLLSNPDFAVLKAVESLPQMLASVGVGTTVASKSAGHVAAAAEGLALKAGLSPGMSAAAGEKAAAEWLASKAADKAVRIAGSATEAGLAVGGAAQSIREKLDDFEVPTEVDGKKRKLTEQEKQAAMAVADRYMPVVGLTGVISYALGGMESALVRNAVSKQLSVAMAKSPVARPGAVIKSGTSESGEEILQTLPEQVGENAAERTFNEKKKLTEGVGAGMGQGAVLGGLMGGGHALIAGGKSKSNATETPSNGEAKPEVPPETNTGTNGDKSPPPGPTPSPAPQGAQADQNQAKKTEPVPPVSDDALAKIHATGNRDLTDIKDSARMTERAAAKDSRADVPEGAIPASEVLGAVDPTDDQVAARMAAGEPTATEPVAPVDVVRPDGTPFSSKRAADMALTRMKKADPTVTLEPVQTDADKNHWVLRPASDQQVTEASASAAPASVAQPASIPAENGEQLSSRSPDSTGLQPDSAQNRQIEETRVNPLLNKASSEKPLTEPGSPLAAPSLTTEQQPRFDKFNATKFKLRVGDAMVDERGNRYAVDHAIKDGVAATRLIEEKGGVTHTETKLFKFENNALALARFRALETKPNDGMAEPPVPTVRDERAPSDSASSPDIATGSKPGTASDSPVASGKPELAAGNVPDSAARVPDATQPQGDGAGVALTNRERGELRKRASVLKSLRACLG